MKSITIHGVDDQLAKLIKDRARADGLSINKTVKLLLEQALGIKLKAAETNKEQFKEFCGIWTKDDLEEFEAATEDMNKIDEDEWA